MVSVTKTIALVCRCVKAGSPARGDSFMECAGVTDLRFPADACFLCGNAAAIANLQREAISGMLCSSDEEQIHAEKNWLRTVSRTLPLGTPRTRGRVASRPMLQTQFVRVGSGILTIQRPDFIDNLLNTDRGRLYVVRVRGLLSWTNCNVICYWYHVEASVRISITNFNVLCGFPVAEFAH